MAARLPCSPTSSSSTSASPGPSETDRESLEESDSMSKVCVMYNMFFILPETRPIVSSKCLARCKLCQKTYKYTLTSKGNLLKHFETAHPKKLYDHKEEQRKRRTELPFLPGGQCTLNSDGSVKSRPKLPFKNQSKILTSVVKNLCGRGGLPLNVVEQDWFREFMRDVEPKFDHTSRVAVSTRLDALYEEEKRKLLVELDKLANVKPSLTVDFWTGCNAKSYMGATVHYIHESKLKSHVLYFVEVKPPHTSDVIKDQFEVQLDNHGISCFQVVTDNAANMKHAFETELLLTEDENSDSSNTVCEHDDEAAENGDLEYWTTIPLKIKGWIGCNAHLIQLVVHDGCNELKGYPRIRSILAKVKAIATFSRRSSHFAYALSHKLPVPCDTRWSSYLKLYDHVLKHIEEINDALKSVNRNDLVITKPQVDILSLITKVLQFFSEATNILQQEIDPTTNRVIPVIDSLENALLQTNRDNTAVNAFCEALLTSLKRRFGFLLDSKLFQAATALDPAIKLSFTDHHQDNKFFVFSSDDVTQAVKSLLPSYNQPQPSLRIQQAAEQMDPAPSKKKRLMDFSSISDESCMSTINDIDTEIQAYFDQPRISTDTLKFWTQRKKSQLSYLALQLLSVPCSSAPVERLFSKAGIVLSQRRSRISNAKLEKLLFIK